MRPLRLKYTREEQVRLARALESSIMQCLANADQDRDNAEKWFMQAHKMEQKWTTDFGRHYSYWLYEVKNETDANQVRPGSSATVA